jgi:hypothetical protein
MAPAQPIEQPRTLIDALLEEQSDLTAVERFARWHDSQPVTAIGHPSTGR